MLSAGPEYQSVKAWVRSIAAHIEALPEAGAAQTMFASGR
jgi:hypothetical protein